MAVPQALGHKHLDLAVDELVPSVSRERLEVGVHVLDRSAGVDEDDASGKGVEEMAPGEGLHVDDTHEPVALGCDHRIAQATLALEAVAEQACHGEHDGDRGPPTPHLGGRV